MLNDAQFQSKKINHDIYYDFPDYRLYKNWVYFRNRNGKFELKIGDDEMAGVCEEIEDDEEIKKYFKTNKPLVELTSVKPEKFDWGNYIKEVKKLAGSGLFVSDEADRRKFRRSFDRRLRAARNL